MDHRVDHFENRILKLEKSFRHLSYNQSDNAEKVLGKRVVILLHEVHQRRNQHGHERHRVRLTF